MMQIICGTDTSPLRGDVRGGRRNPTFRIGLMSVAPSEQKQEIIKITILVVVFVSILTACSARVEYVPTNYVVAEHNAINVNRATAVELEKLPNIGPKTAENIIRFRDEQGPFRRPEHLMMIRGMSQKRFLEIRKFIKTE
ncbi:MAG: helix-hairpin-helix domain-containing protein [Pyrinomonadaceae bacterium]